jgi:hypothetical protein
MMMNASSCQKRCHAIGSNDTLARSVDALRGILTSTARSWEAICTGAAFLRRCRDQQCNQMSRPKAVPNVG